jgi:hypothetical protein
VTKGAVKLNLAYVNRSIKKKEHCTKESYEDTKQKRFGLAQVSFSVLQIYRLSWRHFPACSRYANLLFLDRLKHVVGLVCKFVIDEKTLASNGTLSP